MNTGFSNVPQHHARTPRTTFYSKTTQTYLRWSSTIYNTRHAVLKRIPSLPNSNCTTTEWSLKRSVIAAWRLPQYQQLGAEAASAKRSNT